MSLATNVQNLAIRVASEAKSLRTLINGNAADLSGLTTVTKTSLMDAVNEIASAVGSAGATIDDTGTSTISVWSSSKTNTSISAAVSALVASSPAALDTLNELAAALGGDAAFATTVSTALGLRVRADAAQSFTAGQMTQGRANLGAGTSSLVIGTAAGTAADAAALATALALKAPLASPTFTGTVAGVTKTHVGLGSVDNTADPAKPVSTAQATAIALKASNLSVGDTATDYVASFEAGLL